MRVAAAATVAAMGEVVVLNLNLTGEVPNSLHVHLTMSKDMEEVLATLTTLETNMTALSDAVSALKDRINVDVDELKRQIADKDALLQAALATDAADAATIADLTAQNDAKNADIADTLTSLGSIDPLTDFPGVEPPADVPPADVPPVDEPPADA